MNIKIMKAAISASLQRVAAGIKLDECPKDCKLIDCPKTCEIPVSQCMRDEIKQLKEAEHWLLLLEASLKPKTIWQQANNLDHCIQQLYKHCELSADDVDTDLIMVLDGQPLTISFTPATFSDLQRLFHRQVASLYCDDIEQ